ncbi:MAG: hypothetical protein WBF17_21530 [Phycisphaerae bacterium]
MEWPRARHRAGVLLTAVLAAGGVAAGEMALGARGDGVVDLHVGGRDLVIRTDGAEINGFILTSEAGLLAGDPCPAGLGLFTTDEDSLIADQFGYALDGLHDLGRALGGETAFEQLQQDLTLTYTIQGAEGIHTATIMAASAGDADVDGDVDRDDFRAVEAGFGRAGALWTTGDFNGDGRADFRDYLLWKANVAPSSPGGIPEPAALLLIGGAAAPVVLKRRRSRARRAAGASRSETPRSLFC